MWRQKESAVSEPSAMAQVVESERDWRNQLASARVEAEALVAAAEAEAWEAASALERTLPGLLAERRSSRDAEAAREVAAIAEEAGRAAMRLEAFADDAVRRIADEVLCLSPWLRNEDDR